ncbi:hypothetical protein GCM10010912_58150 [Paenibacillus albidus]|uniref:Uncharacterized protein n=1 Tax=Paenibacillus albidus TaxID=2041023 RepID=A0A917D0M0_9BACL|nr:hypothetical protein [Paenibacillus albidus]GGG05877.1 hypothetical protein GCM10010912_58150 [Paenibacillus albidus]
MDGKPLVDTTKVWEKATAHISHYLDLKKGVTESEVVEVLGDAFKLVGFVKNTTTLIMQKRFESFLKGFNSEGTPTEAQIEKLIDYIDDETKAEFIADTFSKIMLARSSKACLIMGTLLNEFLEKKDQLTHDKLVCMQALSQFFDDDIKNFNFIRGYLHNSKKRSVRPTGQFIGKAFSSAISEKGLDKHSVFLTIEKAVSAQLLVKYNEVKLDIAEDDPSISSSAEVEEYFQVTEPGESLNWYIIKCGLYV